MFIPQVARRLIENYSHKGDMVCDIFCGSGTALVESRLIGRNSIGIDLNPLATFLARVKTSELEESVLLKNYSKLLDHLAEIKIIKSDIPDFFNLDFWFKKDVIADLARLKKAIDKVKDKKVRDFFLVSFSETVRLSSNSKRGEFKLVRYATKNLEMHTPKAIDIFKKKTESNIKGMSSFYNDVDKNTQTKIIYGDSSKEHGIKSSSVDCIITSPPYGDSRTTVAYGQFSRLSSQWLGIYENPANANSLDNDLLGGKPAKDFGEDLESKTLHKIISIIAAKDEKRARDVVSFYNDLNECLKNAYRILKPQKYFCLVVGNRLVKQVRIPTDIIIAELGEALGFTCENIFIRNIPGKRMPIKTSPTNVKGALEETMIKESIVVLKKTR
jgi:site-specific DNA-methyltransferase (cytosine-N4-specific)